MDDRSRMARSTSSRSVDKCATSKSAPKITEECKKFSQTSRTTPFLRACGCAHRFSPTSHENIKSLSGFKRRSKSCTPVRTHFRIESDESGMKLPKKNDSLTRHISEDNLHFKRIMEIKEKLELIPVADEDYEYAEKDKSKPRRYKTTICIDLNSSERKYTEEITFEVRPTMKGQIERIFMPAYTTRIEATIEHILSTNDGPIDE
ncbi:hypothetical protein V9T40_010087 [Parthenolecanium corni]|uniref:Uncharacterized protein n=1 Tax=Parthenolecanium corni TaxID=536013 RepID=A0AAN9Y5U8_9HEMI